jgi:hypothetical protein
MVVCWSLSIQIWLLREFCMGLESCSFLAVARHWAGNLALPSERSCWLCVVCTDFPIHNARIDEFMVVLYFPVAEQSIKQLVTMDGLPLYSAIDVGCPCRCPCKDLWLGKAKLLKSLAVDFWPLERGCYSMDLSHSDHMKGIFVWLVCAEDRKDTNCVVQRIQKVLLTFCISTYRWWGVKGLCFGVSYSWFKSCVCRPNLQPSIKFCGFCSERFLVVSRKVSCCAGIFNKLWVVCKGSLTRARKSLSVRHIATTRM